MVTKQTRTYAQSIEGHRNNPFMDIIRRGFNAIGRAHIRQGHQIIPVMEVDGSVNNYKVTKVAETYAIIERDGEIFGVTFDE